MQEGAAEIARWQIVREEGLKLLEKYPELKKTFDVEVQLKKNQKLSVRPELKKAVRSDYIMWLNEEKADTVMIESWVTKHFDEFKNYSDEVLMWLHQWMDCYDFDHEELMDLPDNKIPEPDHIEELDYALYVLFGGISTPEWRLRYTGMAYCTILYYVLKQRKREAKYARQKLIRVYLSENPDVEHYLLEGQVPPSYEKIKSKVPFYEISQYWEYQRSRPKITNTMVGNILEKYRDDHDGEWPSKSGDCEYIISADAAYTPYLERIYTNIDRKIFARKVNEAAKVLRTEGAFEKAVEERQSVKEKEELE